MFDTVTINHAYQTSVPRQVRDTFIKQGGRYVKPSSQDGSLLSLNRTVPSLFWSEKPDGLSYLTARVSLPKLLYGTNTITLSEADVARALSAISEFTSPAAGVDFDAASANVTSLDVCHNFQVGEENTYAYLGALRDANIPRMDRHLIDSTVYFQNRSQKVVVYAKHAETAALAKDGKATDEDLKRSVGMMRIERRYLITDAVQALVKRLELSNRCAATLLQRGVSDTVMNDTIKELGLDHSIENGDSRRALLREYYGMTDKCEKLEGFLARCDDFGADNLIALGIYDKRTFYRRKADVIAAGAWLVTNKRATLPPLRLVRSNLRAVAA
jgi:hypothetical protein